MSFKRFDTEDIVVSSDSISSPAWSNNQVTLSTFAYNPDQIGTGSAGGQYYWNVYQTGSTDQAAAIQFSIAYGHRLGSGSIPYNSSPSCAGKSPSATIYGQYRTLINGDENTDFQFGTSTPNSVFFISVERARFKEKILPGSLTLVLENSSSISLTDNSVTASVDTYKDSGREYLIYSGAAGQVHSDAKVYGKLYPDVGIVVLNGDLLESEGAISTIDLTNDLTASAYQGNPSVIYNSIEAGQNFTLRAEETLSSNYVFVRARNSEFNYSTNPSNISGSGELQHNSMIDTPQAYVTAVGLYNDNNELLAVSKLSTPLLKDFTKEALIRIKLDY